MNIASLFRQRQLHPAWSYTTSGILWRLIFSETDFIIGEDRDTEKKTVSFFCLNAANGDLLWKNDSYGESWWIGIEGVVHDKVFLHGFKKPDMPEHAKIIAVDLGTGRELWRNNEYAFLSATRENVLGFRDMFERRLYYELDPLTGEFLRELKEPPSDLYDTKTMSHGRSDFLFPEALNDGTAEYPLLAPMISKHCELQSIKGAVEYVRCGGKVVFNYHSVLKRNEQKNLDELQNNLCVVDESTGNKIYADIVNSSTPSPVPDSFFVDEPIVYYIKDKHTLVAVTLPG